MGLKDYRPSKEVTVDGETVVVMGLTVGESEELAESINEDAPAILFQRRVVAMCVRDDKGGLYFESEDEVKGIHRVVLEQLFDAAAELSGLKDESVEEAEKN